MLVGPADDLKEQFGPALEKRHIPIHESPADGASAAG